MNFAIRIICSSCRKKKRFVKIIQVTVSVLLKSKNVIFAPIFCTSLRSEQNSAVDIHMFYLISLEFSVRRFNETLLSFSGFA